jgi:nitrogen fixation protein FixH
MSKTSRRVAIEPWPIALAALLAAMIGTSVGFYRIAARNPDPAVAGDSFLAGTAFAAEARAEARARAQGWTLDVTTVQTPDGVAVTAHLLAADGSPLDAERLSVRRERPAEGGYDADFAIAGGDPVDVVLPRVGRWSLTVRAERGDAVVQRQIPAWMP